MRIFSIFLLLLASCSKQDAPKDSDWEKISFYKGYLFGNRHLEDLKEYDPDQMIAGIYAAANKTEIPEDDYKNLLSSFQENELKKNLKEAEEHLIYISQNENIQCVINNKLYYKIVKSGNGRVLKANDLPSMTFSLKTLDKDGNEILLHSESEPIRISFEDTIDGFREGVRGMKEGEERSIRH